MGMDEFMQKFRVLIADCSIDRKIYRPDTHWGRSLERMGIPFGVIHLPTERSGGSLTMEYELGRIGSAYSHVIITGSESNATESAKWSGHLDKLVRDSVSKGVPLLGSCFGHQVIVKILSSVVHVGDADPSGIELGYYEIELNDAGKADPLLSDVPEKFWTFASHFQEVKNAPEPWKVLAKSRLCEYHIIRYGDEKVWGVQSHPEMMPMDTDVLLRGFERLEELQEDKKAIIRKALEMPRKFDDILDKLVINFLKSKEFDEK